MMKNMSKILSNKISRVCTIGVESFSNQLECKRLFVRMYRQLFKLILKLSKIDEFVSIYSLSEIKSLYIL